MNLRRFAILSISINAALLIATSVVINWSWVDNTRTEFIDKIRDITIQRLLNEVEWPLAILDLPSIKRICNSASLIDEVQEIRISDKKGNVLCVKDGSISGKARTFTTHVHDIILKGNDSADFGGVGIGSEKDVKVGQLLINWSNDGYETSVQRAFYIRLALGFFAILLMSATAFYITRKNIDFILSVKRILASVISGEYIETTATHKISEHEEISHLLKKMANELTRRNSELENNVTLLNEAYSSLKETKIAKEQLLRAISHDIRTPVNVIVGIVEVISGEFQIGHHSNIGEERITNLNSAINILEEQIDQLTELERFQSGNITLENEIVNLKQFLLETESIYSTKANKKGLKLIGHIDNSIDVDIEIDKKKFRRILLNILDNAVKYTYKGHIKISARTSDAKYIIDISDTGIGILEENKSRVFDTFFQEERAINTNPSGYGMGLSIVRMLADALNISITLESKPGNGSTFTILIESSAFLARKTNTIKKNPPRERLGISALVLDDNITNNMIIKETLSHLGVDCKTFTLSEMAFDELSHSEPDILFVDYNMPDISGIDFVEELKFNNLARGSKLICITGDTTKSTRIKLDEHFDQVLYKPVRQKSLQELIDALKASLNTKRHLIELGKQDPT